MAYTYGHTYIHTYIFYTICSVDRSVSTFFYSTLKLITHSRVMIQKCNFFMFYIRAPLWLIIIIIICWYFYVDTSSSRFSRRTLLLHLATLCFLITFSSQNFASSRLIFHLTKSIFFLIYATQCFFLNITCIRYRMRVEWDAK